MKRRSNLFTEERIEPRGARSHRDRVSQGVRRRNPSMEKSADSTRSSNLTIGTAFTPTRLKQASASRSSELTASRKD